MKGLRTQESTNFINFFKIVQTVAEQKDSIFFLDTCEGNDRNFLGMEIADLSGWLVPKEKADEFQSIWEKQQEDDTWVDFFCFAIPKVDGEVLRVEFSNI